jgi:23S rRNA (uracil1939-C5)-methyltransferase
MLRLNCQRPIHIDQYDVRVNQPQHTLRIDKLVAGGEGLGRLDDGRVVFVPDVIAGETVEVELVETKRDFARARLVSITEAAPTRREPPCQFVADGCGGCNWQHVEDTAQLRLKSNIVEEAFARTARLDVEVHRRKTIDASAKRTTVRMIADENGYLGFRQRDSHDVVTTSTCMVAHDLINAFLNEPVLEGPGELTIRVGARTGEVGMWCHEGRIRDGVGSHAQRGQRAPVNEIVSDQTYRISMSSFFQSSPEAAELLITTLSTDFDSFGIEGGTLLDAYGGVGLFSKAFASRFDELYLVESNPHACRDAVHNLSDCAATIEEVEFERWEPIDVDVVIADPARDGLGKRGVATLLEVDAPFVALVSCDAVAGARDVAMLVEGGYDLDRVSVLDIFPHTHHVEVVSILTK